MSTGVHSGSREVNEFLGRGDIDPGRESIDIWTVMPAALSWQTTHFMQGTLPTLPSFTMTETCGNFSECREYIRKRQVLIYCIYIISKPSRWNESHRSWHFFDGEVYLTEAVQEVDDRGDIEKSNI